MTNKTKDNILEFLCVLVIIGIIFAWLWVGGN